MVFLMDPEHSIGCDSKCLGEVCNNLISMGEKFGHDLPRVCWSACALDPRTGGERVPTHQSMEASHFADFDPDI